MKTPFEPILAQLNFGRYLRLKLRHHSATLAYCSFADMVVSGRVMRYGPFQNHLFAKQ
jgi:hypothetical protein